MIKRCLLILWVLLAFGGADAQETAIGQWQAHISYGDGKWVAEVGDKIYCATSTGLFYYDKKENVLERLSPVDGFSGVRIQAMRYDPGTRYLLIAYDNGLIDMVKDNKIFTVTGIFDRTEKGSKRINDFYFHNRKVYISSTLGAVVYDLSEKEFGDTYRIGDQGETVEIKDITISGKYIYASTEAGLKRADVNSINLLNYQEWEKAFSGDGGEMVSYNNKVYAVVGDSFLKYQNGNWQQYMDSTVDGNEIRSLDVFNDRLLVTTNKFIYSIDKSGNITEYASSGANHALVDNEGTLWYALDRFTLVGRFKSGKVKYRKPNGPSSPDAFRVSYGRGTVWIASGAWGAGGGPTYNPNGFYAFAEGDWMNYSLFEISRLGKARDIVDVTVNPVNNHIFAASMTRGLFELKGKEVIRQYKSQNSSLGFVKSLGDSQKVRVASIVPDEENNLWITNPESTKPLSVRKNDGSWKSFALGNNVRVYDMVIDQSGQKWIINGFGSGVLVFNDNGTIENVSDDRYLSLNKSEGNGGLPTLGVLSLAVDRDNQLWLGTKDGVAVIYDPAAVFSGGDFDAQQVWVQSDDEPGLLLARQTVTAIAVDEGNRKWFGTLNGAWLTNPDGSEILHHFTTENSPLLSDQVNDIGINDRTGEVFFATSKGVISYRGEATEGKEKHQNAYVYPNPVRPDYKGPIAVKGLVTDALVKISDISGNIVYEMKATGGQAVWDGHNLSGKEVKTGVYLIYSSSADGSETFITKLLIVR